MDFALLLTLFVGALAFGASGCLIGCMPLLSPILTSDATQNKNIKPWLVALAAGRIVGYSTIAALSFVGLGYIKNLLASSEYISKFFGAFVILVSVILFVQIFYPFIHRCGLRGRSFLTPFGVGLGLSFSFCPAVLQLISLSGASSTIVFALLCGVIFGLGVSLVPTLFYGFALYPLIRNGVLELVKFKKWIEITSSLLLAVVGVLIFFGFLKV